MLRWSPRDAEGPGDHGADRRQPVLQRRGCGMRRLRRADHRPVLLGHGRSAVALCVPEVLRVQTGAGLAGVLLRQRREHLLQGGLLQVRLFYPANVVCYFPRHYSTASWCGSFELTLNIPRGVLREPPLLCYWLTSVEINKHKIFDTNNA